MLIWCEVTFRSWFSGFLFAYCIRLYWPHWWTQSYYNSRIFILIIMHSCWNWHSSHVSRGLQHLQSSCITIPATWKLFICAMKKQPDNEPSETARESVWQWTLLRGTSLIMHYKHNLHYKKFLMETCDRFLGYLWIKKMWVWTWNTGGCVCQLLSCYCGEWHYSANVSQ